MADHDEYLTAQAQMDALRHIIITAFTAANQLRPYSVSPGLLDALTPPGGNWRHELTDDGARLVLWHAREVAAVNLKGDLPDQVAGEIAMAVRAAPVMDAALRVIMALAASDNDCRPLIKQICTTAIAYVEMPAPRPPEPADGEDEGESDDEQT